MPLRMWQLRATAVLLGLTMALSACSAPPDTPEKLEGWQQLALPGSMAPTTVIHDGDGALLIGGSRVTNGARSPMLVRMPTDGSDAATSVVRLTPTTSYGEIAELTSISTDDGAITALGAARGGAHANIRWTVWTGTAAGLVDREQTFWTFGGWDVGTLLGVVVDAQGPLVVGTWQGAHGLDGAVWRADGTRWVRQPSPPVLRNTATRQVSPRFVDQQDDGSVSVSGSLLDLTNGVHQSAATWREVDGTWSLSPLPDPGQRSEAWSTACAQTCWSAGIRDGRLAVWSADGLAELPDLPAEDTDAAKVLLSADRVVVVASPEGAGRLLVGHDGTWRFYTAPDGAVQSAALIGSRLYLVVGKEAARKLWVHDLPASR